MLTATDIEVRFGGLTAVSGVSLNAPRDKILSIIGPNGAGKTTLFSVLSGFLAPTHGTVTLDGKRLDGMPAYTVARSGIARTFQIVRPFPDMTVLDNVIVGAYARAASYREASAVSARVLEKVGLYPKRAFLAAHLTLRDLKLLEVAKALATQPKFLLLDEVMAGLNIKEQHDVATMLEGIHADGTGILLVEHSLAMVYRMSDHVICLDSGRKIAEGTATAVLESKEVQAAYMGIDDD